MEDWDLEIKKSSALCLGPKPGGDSWWPKIPNGCAFGTRNISQIWILLRTKYQNSIKNLRISTQHLDKERISDNNPLRGGNLFIHQINLPIQYDSK
jgi:hypothetical protein